MTPTSATSLYRSLILATLTPCSQRVRAVGNCFCLWGLHPGVSSSERFVSSSNDRFLLKKMGDRDGGLERALRQLNLSEAEKKGIMIGKHKAPEAGQDDWHAVGKVLSDKPISTEVIQRTLGWIWSANRGMICKDACDNKFLFSFNHPTAMRRALEDEPWMVGKKDLDAVEFTHVPIWIWVLKLPMGMMNKSVAEIIGNEVGFISRCQC
jgi:hypothetical protein